MALTTSKRSQMSPFGETRTQSDSFVPTHGWRGCGGAAGCKLSPVSRNTPADPRSCSCVLVPLRWKRALLCPDGCAGVVNSAGSGAAAASAARTSVPGALKWTPLKTSRTRGESELGRARYQLRRLHVVAYYDYYNRHYYGRSCAAY